MNQAHMICFQEDDVTARRNLISQVLDWDNNWDPVPICVSKQLWFLFSVLWIRETLKGEVIVPKHLRDQWQSWHQLQATESF